MKMNMRKAENEKLSKENQQLVTNNIDAIWQ